MQVRCSFSCSSACCLAAASWFFLAFGHFGVQVKILKLETDRREHRGPILALSSSAWCCSACMELEHTSRQMSLILICLWRLKQLNIPKRLFRKRLFTSLHCVCPQNMTRLSFWNSKTCDLCMLLHFQSCSRDCPLLLTCKALEFSAWGWSLNSDKNDSLSSLASFHGVLKRYWLLWLTLG